MLLFIIIWTSQVHALNFFGKSPELKQLKQDYIQQQQLLQQNPALFQGKVVGDYRFVTYNVENLKNFGGVVKTIGRSKADVVSLQEVPTSKIAGLAEDLKAQGFTHMAECTTFRKGARLSNVVLSKAPIESSNAYRFADPFGNRCAVEAIVNFGGGNKVLAIGTHLPNKGDSYRAEALQRINALSARRHQEGYTRQAFLGDFNSQKDFVSKQTSGTFADTIDRVEDRSKQVDPKFTQWRGKRIDFVLVNDKIHDTKVTKAGSIPSDGADHIPVFADLKFGQPQTSAPAPISRATDIFKDKGINPFVRKQIQNLGKAAASVAIPVGIIAVEAAALGWMGNALNSSP